MILHGRNLIIKAGGEAIAAARSCQIKVQAEQIPVSSPYTGAWATYRNGRKSWSVSTNHLMLTLRSNVLMVGTTVELEVSIERKGDKTFQGFVDNPTLQSDSAQTWTYIVWDKTRKKFLACLYEGGSNFYFYQNWNGSAAYTDIDDYTAFLDNNDSDGTVYTYIDGDLYAEKLTGNANVQEFDAVGNIGNLAQGTFNFVGNGELTPASLPSPS